MFKLHRKSSVAVYVRHRGTCPHGEHESYPRCDCAKWLRFSVRGQQHRRPAGTWTKGIVEEAARDLQKETSDLVGDLANSRRSGSRKYRPAHGSRRKKFTE